MRWFVVIIFLLSSCSGYEEPYVVGVNNIRVNEMNIRNLDISADLRVHNPNPFGLDLSRTALSIYTDDRLIGTIDQAYETIMPGSSDFNLPIDIKLQLSNIYDGDVMKAVALGNKILTDRQITIVLKGYLYAGKDEVQLKIPIDREEVVEL